MLRAGEADGGGATGTVVSVDAVGEPAPAPPLEPPAPQPPAPQPPAPPAMVEAAEEQGESEADAQGGPAEEPADANLVPPLPHSRKAGCMLYGLAM